MVPRETLYVQSPVQSGDGEVTLMGTSDSGATSPEFKFKSADDSNVVVKVSGSGSGAPRIEIGVYYV